MSTEPAPGVRASRVRTPAQRDDLRQALVEQRTSTVHRIADLKRDFDGIVESTRDVATDDEHDPEGQTIAFERAQLATLVEQAQSHLCELDGALERLDAGKHGDCERCGQPIAAERLAVRPAATTCVACASTDRRRR